MPVNKLSAFRSYRLSLRKLLNYAYSLAARKSGMPLKFGMPSRLFIEITNECNLKCTFCATGMGTLKRPKHTMGLDKFKEIIDDTSAFVLEINFSGYGEPLLNKDVSRMVAYAKNKGMRVWFPSNLLTLNSNLAEELVKSGLDQITVSLDSSSEENYLKHKRSGSLAKTIENIKLLQEAKKKLKSRTPFLQINLVRMNHNEHEIESVRAIALSLKADVFFVKPVNLKVSGYGKEGILQDTGTGEASQDRNKGFFSGKFRCPWLWNTAMVFADGTLAPCCFDAQGSIILGNVFKTPLSKAWISELYSNLRLRLNRQMRHIELCKSCPARLRNNG